MGFERRFMRMFNRKGVSEVVANVLIVLLVIVGVAVIWAVVKPTIQKASDTVQSDCFTVQVEPQSCELSDGVPGTCRLTQGGTSTNTPCNSNTDCPVSGEICSGGTPAGATATLVIKRNPGAGSFEDIEVVFEDATAATERVSSGIASTALDELETTTPIVLNPALTPVKANVALKVNGQLCAMTALPVNCV